MSTILKALEKARQERERQRKEDENIRAQQVVYGAKKSVEPPSPPQKPPQTAKAGEPSPAGRFFFIGIILFIISVGVLGIASFMMYRINHTLTVSHSPKSDSNQAGFSGILSDKDDKELFAPQEQSLTENNTQRSRSPDSPGDDRQIKHEKAAAQSSGDRDTSSREQEQTTPDVHARETREAQPPPTATVPLEPVPSPTPAVHRTSVAPSPTPRKTPVPTPSPSPSPSPAEEKALAEVYTPPDKLGLQIDGIFWDEIKPMAIINGKIVSKGDKIEGMEILEIKKNSLRLKKGNTVYNVLF